MACNQPDLQRRMLVNQSREPLADSFTLDYVDESNILLFLQSYRLHVVKEDKLNRRWVFENQINTKLQVLQKQVNLVKRCRECAHLCAVDYLRVHQTCQV